MLDSLTTFYSVFFFFFPFFLPFFFFLQLIHHTIPLAFFRRLFTEDHALRRKERPKIVQGEINPFTRSQSCSPSICTPFKSPLVDVRVGEDNQVGERRQHCW